MHAQANRQAAGTVKGDVLLTPLPVKVCIVLKPDADVGAIPGVPTSRVGDGLDEGIEVGAGPRFVTRVAFEVGVLYVYVVLLNGFNVLIFLNGIGIVPARASAPKLKIRPKPTTPAISSIHNGIDTLRVSSPLNPDRFFEVTCGTGEGECRN